jgi:hypothetical protein
MSWITPVAPSWEPIDTRPGRDPFEDDDEEE